MKTESEFYNAGVDILRQAFGGTDVLILSDLYRLEPTKEAPGGRVGADLWIEGTKSFVGYQEMDDMMVYGIHLAESIVATILGKQEGYEDIAGNDKGLL